MTLTHTPAPRRWPQTLRNLGVGALVVAAATLIAALLVLAGFALNSRHRLEYIYAWPFKGSDCDRTFIVQFINEPLAKILHGQPAMASGWTSI